MKNDKKLFLLQVFFMIGGQLHYLQYFISQSNTDKIGTLISIVLLVLSLVFCFKRRSIGKLGAILGLIVLLEIRVLANALTHNPNLGTVIQG